MMWLILTGGGEAIRGRYKGTRAQAVAYCKAHYMPKGYKIIRDKPIKLGSK